MNKVRCSSKIEVKIRCTIMFRRD